MTEMTWLEFIAEIVKALAWPAVVVFVVVGFRKHIRLLLPTLESFQLSSFKLEFRKQIHRVAEEAEQALPEGSIRRGYSTEERVQALQLAQISPRAAILEAWLELESAAIDALRMKGNKLSEADSHRPQEVVAQLKAQQLFNELQIEVWNQLRLLRNAAVHVRDARISNESAREYVDMAAAFERLLREKTRGAQ